MATTTAPTGFGRPIWSAIKGGNQIHGVGLIPVTMLFKGSDDDFQTAAIFQCPPSTVGSFKVEAATISFGTAVNDDASNRWDIQLQVGTVSTFEDLGGTALSSATDFAVHTSYSLDIDGPEAATPLKVFLAPGDILRLDFDETGTADDLSAVQMTVTVWLRHSPPGR